MSNVVNVKKRDETGTLRMRRLRKSGRVPAIIYGHGQESVSVSIDTRDVDRIMREGRHVVELGGDVTESALVKDVQWDAFGSQVLHIDLARVDAGESVEVNLAVELRGVAPGTRSGGVVKHSMHELAIRCPANKMPESIVVSINELELENSISAGDLEMPDSVELVSDPASIVVSCVAPTVMEEPTEEGEGGMAEPEVIGRKADDEESDDS